MSNRNELQNRLTRRAVLKTCGGMMSSVTAASAFLNLQATRVMADAGAPSDFKALVCLFMNGGNDSYNMLAPTGTEYADYHTARGTTTNGGIAIPEANMHQIAGPGGRTFGLHPALTSDVSGGTGVKGLYDSGKLSFVANIGSLVEPTNIASYNTAANLPLGLFSHSDLQRHWMTSFPQDRSQLTGWAGKMSDLLLSCNDPSPISMNISMSGANIMQTGDAVAPYSIGTNGATPVSNYFPDQTQTNNTRYRAFSKIQDNILAQTYSNLLAKTFANTHRVAMDAAIEFNTAVNNVPISTTFDANENLSQQMKKIAQVIGANVALGQRRQVFFVQLGGFDNHTNLEVDHEARMVSVSKALSSFHKATVELGVEEKVTTFSISDFARTLSSNGQGSDHAWGGNAIVMGGANINGGQILGDYPTSLLTPEDGNGDTINLGRGRLIPTTSVDVYNSEIAAWFGVQPGDMDGILPNLSNFSGEPAIGMFS